MKDVKIDINQNLLSLKRDELEHHLEVAKQNINIAMSSQYQILILDSQLERSIRVFFEYRERLKPFSRRRNLGNANKNSSGEIVLEECTGKIRLPTGHIIFPDNVRRVMAATNICSTCETTALWIHDDSLIDTLSDLQ